MGFGVVVMVFCGSLVFAQMGGGMNEDKKGGNQQGLMMDHGQMGGGMNEGGKGATHRDQMMEHGQMMGGMADMGHQMAEMMGTISGRMKDMPEGDMKAMSGVMKDISQQMMAMSKVMGGGKVSTKEMKKMQDRVMDIKNRMPGTDMHK